MADKVSGLFWDGDVEGAGGVRKNRSALCSLGGGGVGVGRTADDDGGGDSQAQLCILLADPRGRFSEDLWDEQALSPERQDNISCYSRTVILEGLEH